MRTKTKLCAVTILIYILNSCAPTNTKNTVITGTWKSIGYGKMLTIDAKTYKYCDITSNSCLPSKQGNISEVKRSITLVNDTLAIKRGYSVYYYTKTTTLPEPCYSSSENNYDPLYNFEVFADTYKTHYAYFKLNKIHWDTLYLAAKNKITANTSEVQLYLILQELIDGVHDNHGYVEPTDSIYELATQRTTLEKITQKKAYGDFEIAEIVANHHIDKNLTKDSWLVKWGTIADNIGYLQLNAMWLFADLTLSDSSIKADGFVTTYMKEFDKLNYAEQVEMEREGISAIMDKAMKDLDKTKFIIIDLRFNGGGQDEVGLEVLRRFNGIRRQVASKKAKHNTSYTTNTPIFLEVSKKPYTKPVYLLTSRQSASAADMMALSAMTLPQVKRIGSRTNGALSDALEKTLPNGWYFSLSNEVYTDLNGKHYENIGVPVDFELDYPEDRQLFFRSIADDLEQDKRTILQAIEKLQLNTH